MPRRATPLTALQVKNNAAGRYCDGEGLWLEAFEDGRAYWFYQAMIDGRTRSRSLGRARGRNSLSLSEARKAADALTMMRRRGEDPFAGRARGKRREDRPEPKPCVTFKQAALELYDSLRHGWSQHHAAEWIGCFERYAFPVLGDADVATIDTSSVLRAIQPKWVERVQTMKRARERMANVFAYAMAKGYRPGERNPADWDTLKYALPSPSSVANVKHMAAVPWKQMPEFMARLRRDVGPDARCVEFQILTAVRPSEARLANWDEIDLEDGVWRIPGKRTKGGREHRVPLSPAAKSVLRTMEPLRDGSGLVFASPRGGGPLGVNSAARVVQSIAPKATAHGMRSCFRDFAAESTSHPRELIEVAMGHIVAGAAEAAYWRGDMMERRRALMSDWAVYLAGGAK